MTFFILNKMSIQKNDFLLLYSQFIKVYKMIYIFFLSKKKTFMKKKNLYESFKFSSKL